MPTDRVLIEVVTAANMAGVNQANAGLLGMNTSTVLLGATFAGLGLAIKSSMQIAAEHTAAESNLSQAVGTTKLSLKSQQDQITAFMQTNRDYISNQADVINSYANLIRTGLDQTQVQRVMNDALDLAAIKGISLSDATAALTNAEFGRMRGLIDLGITTAKYTDANGNLILASHSVAQAMAEVDAKVKGGRQSLSLLQQSTDALKTDWEQFATGPGTAFNTALGDGAAILDLFYQGVQKVANDNALWSSIDNKIIDTGKAVESWYANLLPEGPLKDQLLKNAGLLGAPTKPASVVPPAETSYQAAQKAKAILDAQQGGATGTTLSAGSSIVPPIIQSQLDAKNQAKSDAQKLQAQNDRIIAHLERVEANTGRPVNVFVNMSAEDRQAALILRKAMAV